ncbi:hypothetical protein AV530_004302 [Patagioenas fasciata monilis]|uniref:Uncharacterized protein n=1 Tax=Patagioenas fasciata monilis TaxID=372326 RepID=A0A1V4K984_PATFA|nr:hypothetical protein AV530_004302 [Patagioenas fasciata monilis]
MVSFWTLKHVQVSCRRQHGSVESTSSSSACFHALAPHGSGVPHGSSPVLLRISRKQCVKTEFYRSHSVVCCWAYQDLLWHTVQNISVSGPVVLAYPV